MKSLFKLAAIIFTATVATLTIAGGDHVPRHGGQMKETNAFDIEFVAKADVLQVYLSDHGKAVDLSQVTAKVTVLKGQEKLNFDLKPAGAMLELKGKFDVSKGTKAVVQIVAGAKTATAQYVLK